MTKEFGKGGLRRAFDNFAVAVGQRGGPSLAMQRHDPSWEAWKALCDEFTRLSKKLTADQLAAEGARLSRAGNLVVFLYPSQEWMAVEAQVPFLRYGNLLTTPAESR